MYHETNAVCKYYCRDPALLRLHLWVENPRRSSAGSLQKYI